MVYADTTRLRRDDPADMAVQHVNPVNPYGRFDLDINARLALL
jgi:hypothetical protein